MDARTGAIQKHNADQLALERHILEAVERQREDSRVVKDVDANKVLIETERALQKHIAALEQVASQYGGEGESSLKAAITEALGWVAGMYDRLREQPVSRMLRDDYTALSLASMGYTAFHTFGLAIREQRIADLALEHLKDLTPLLIELSRVLPHVVAKEVAEEAKDYVADAGVGMEAERNTHQAWTREAAHVA